MEPKEEIRLKLDLAEVIGDYVQLKPAGSGAFKGLCPFHAERTPSFHVSRERQIWKCFGCDKGGDVFAFVMEMEGLSFPETMRMLAKKAGVVLPEYKPMQQQSDNKQTLKAINEAAANYYSLCLREYPNGEAVRAYVASRNIEPELREKFRLGASPSDWDVLSLHLTKLGYSEALIIESGLAVRRKTGSGIVDRFRERLMIPLCDANGDVVGFTARALPHAQGDQAKYINSPETPIYHKGGMLYGLHLAKTAIRHRGEVIIVEGNLDVIASHKAGVANVVGSSGTALTETQLRTLARYTKRLVFCLDDDNAGFAAAKRVVELALNLQAADQALQFDVRCLVIPPGAGKDPDEIVTRDPAEWVKIADNSQPVIEYYFQKVIQRFEEQGGSTSIEARRRLIDELLPQVSQLSRADEQYLYLLRVSDATHVGLDVLKTMLKPSSVAVGSRQLAVGKNAPPNPRDTKPSTFESPQFQSAALLLGAALRYDSYVEPILANLPMDKLSEPWPMLYTALKAVYTSQQTQSPAPTTTLFSRLRTYLEEQGQPAAVQALDELTLRSDEIFVGLAPDQVRQEVEKHLALLASAQDKTRRKQLEADIRHAEIAGDSSRLTQLLAEYSELLSRSATG